MILKRYGTMLHSVQPDFDSRALTEIGFRRDRRLSLRAADFDEAYEAVETEELSAQADGPVHDYAEQELLVNLERELRRAEADAGEDGVVVIESRQGVDYPRPGTESRIRFVKVGIGCTSTGPSTRRCAWAYFARANELNPIAPIGVLEACEPRRVTRLAVGMDARRLTMLIRRSSTRFRGQRDYTLSSRRETRLTASERLLGRVSRALVDKSRRERTTAAA